MVKNYVYDLGGVLLNYDLQRDTDALQAVGLPLYNQWKQYPELSRIANAYLNGLLPAPDFYQQIRPYCKSGVTDAEIEYSMTAVIADIPAERLQLLIELRQQGANVYLLSNINANTWQIALQGFQEAGYRVEDCFDRVFLSYEMQLAKPDPAIFRRVIEETGLFPTETVYYDDDARNIESARTLGFQAEWVEMKTTNSE